MIAQFSWRTHKARVRRRFQNDYTRRLQRKAMAESVESMNIDDFFYWLAEQGIPLELCRKFECKPVYVQSV